MSHIIGKRVKSIIAFLLGLAVILLAAAPTWATITTINSATNSGTSGPATCSWPASIQTGDIIIANIQVFYTSAPTITDPTGWVGQTVGSDVTVGSYAKHHTVWHLYTSGDSAPSWTLSGSSYWSVGMMAFRGVNQTSPIDQTTTANGTGAGPVTAPTLTPGHISEMAVLHSGAYSTSARTFSAESLATWGAMSEASGGYDVGANRTANCGAYLLGGANLTATGAASATISGTTTTWVGRLTLLRPQINLSTTMAAVSAASSPIFNAGRNLNTTIATVTAAASPVVAIGRPLATAMRAVIGTYPLAQSGFDWPDYSIVPQMDHFYNLLGPGGYTDTPGPGKTQYDLTADGAGLTWQNDWAGRANQAVQMDGTHQLYTVNHPDLCDLGSTWALSVKFLTPPNFNAVNPSILYSISGAPTNGYRLYVTTTTGTLIFRTYNAGSVYEDNGYALTANTKYHVVYVMTGGNIYGYVNGTLFETKALTAPGANSTNWFALPYIDANFQYYEVGVLKGAILTGTQVQNLDNTWVDCGNGVYKSHCNNVATITNPAAVVARAITSTIASVTTAASSALGVTRNLGTAINSVTVGSTPVLDITGGGTTYNLVTSIQSVSAASTPNLAITRPLVSGLSAVSAASTAIAAISRALTTAANAVTQASSAIMLILHNLISALLAVTAAASAALPVTRNLSSTIASQGAAGTPSLAVSRPLSGSLQAVSAGSTPALPVTRKLITTLQAQAQLSEIDLTIQGLIQLVTNIQTVTALSNIEDGVIRNLQTTPSAQTAMGNINLAITRQLATIIQILSAAGTPELKVIRVIQTTINGVTQASTIILFTAAQYNLVTVIQITTSGSAAVLRIYVFPSPGFTAWWYPAEKRDSWLSAEWRPYDTPPENRTIRIGGK